MIQASVNGKVILESNTAILHDVKSEFGKMFYHDSDVKSIAVLMDGIPFLQLQKDDTGKVILRYDAKSED